MKHININHLSSMAATISKRKSSMLLLFFNSTSTLMMKIYNKSFCEKRISIEKIHPLNSRKNILLIPLKKLSNVSLNLMLKFSLPLTSITLIAKRLLLSEVTVFFILINCRNGLTTTLKNFFKLPISLKVNLIAVMLKSNLPFLMN